MNEHVVIMCKEYLLIRSKDSALGTLLLPTSTIPTIIEPVFQQTFECHCNPSSHEEV